MESCRFVGDKSCMICVKSPMKLSEGLRNTRGDVRHLHFMCKELGNLFDTCAVLWRTLGAISHIGRELKRFSVYMRLGFS